MAQTTCGKCGQQRFEMKELAIAGANFRHMVVQCANCGVPINTTEFQNPAALLREIKETVEKIERNQ